MSIEFFIRERNISEEMKAAALLKINRTAVGVAKVIQILWQTHKNLLTNSSKRPCVCTVFFLLH